MSSSSEKEAVTFAYQWEVRLFDLSDFEFDESYESNVFTTCYNNISWHWRLHLKPRGCKRGIKAYTDHMALYLDLVQGPVSTVTISFQLGFEKPADGTYKKITDFKDAKLNQIAPANSMLDHKWGVWNQIPINEDQLRKKKMIGDEQNNKGGGGTVIRFMAVLHVPTVAFDPERLIQKQLNSALAPVPNQGDFVYQLYEEIIDPVRPDSSDFEIVSKEGQRFHCHKLILGKQSRYFLSPHIFPQYNGGHNNTSSAAGSVPDILTPSSHRHRSSFRRSQGRRAYGGNNHGRNGGGGRRSVSVIRTAAGGSPTRNSSAGHGDEPQNLRRYRQLLNQQQQNQQQQQQQQSYRHQHRRRDFVIGSGDNNYASSQSIHENGVVGVKTNHSGGSAGGAGVIDSSTANNNTNNNNSSTSTTTNTNEDGGVLLQLGQQQQLRLQRNNSSSMGGGGNHHHAPITNTATTKILIQSAAAAGVVGADKSNHQTDEDEEGDGDGDGDGEVDNEDTDPHHHKDSYDVHQQQQQQQLLMSQHHHQHQRHQHEENPTAITDGDIGGDETTNSDDGATGGGQLLHMMNAAVDDSALTTATNNDGDYLFDNHPGRRFCTRTWKTILHFIYRGKVDEEFGPSSPVEEIVEAAHMMDLHPRLKMECEKVLVTKISMDNIAELQQLSARYDLHILKNMVISFLGKHWVEIPDEVHAKLDLALAACPTPSSMDDGNDPDKPAALFDVTRNICQCAPRQYRNIFSN